MGLIESYCKRRNERRDEQLERNLEALRMMMSVESPDPTYRKGAFLAPWLLRFARLQRRLAQTNYVTVATTMAVALIVLLAVLKVLA